MNEEDRNISNEPGLLMLIPVDFKHKLNLGTTG